MTGPELTTRRCALRPLTGDHAGTLHRLWTSAGVRRFLWDDEVIPLERTRAVIEQSRELFKTQRYGLWGAWPHDRVELIGFGGLWPFRDPPELELVYGVREDRWGVGYATEIGRAVTEYCFGSLDMAVVRASTDAPNAASRRVLERLGFGFVRRGVVDGLDTLFYEARPGAVDRAANA